MNETYISVSQVNNYIKNIFEAEIMLQNICVYGEISSYSLSGGNAYFNLKDEDGMLACVLFGASKFESPKIGDMVLVRGSMNYYMKGGKLSFNAFSIMPYGRGLLYEKFLQLKNELEAKGYFATEHKKAIPEKCRRIGVVSSPTGAVIRDIIDVTHRRNDTIDIVLYPVKVQGLGADREIATGIDFFSDYKDVDVVIVARGGGSMEDLEPFNSEVVATATYNCKKPIVSAVGHETDFTIIDFVSDLRAPTPSAAAELIAWDKNLFVADLYSNLRHIERLLKNQINEKYREVLYCSEKIDNVISSKVFNVENAFDKVTLKFEKINNIIEKTQNKLDLLSVKLDIYNPAKISSMGYSKVLQKGKSVSSINKIDYDSPVTISMIDGNIDARLVRGNNDVR